MKTYLIKQGKHYPEGWNFGFEKIDISFSFKLEPDCWYDPATVIPGWNKIKGFADTFDNHKNSIRLVWMPSSDIGKFRLAAYAYVNGIMQWQEFPGTYYSTIYLVKMRWSNYNYEVTLYDIEGRASGVTRTIPQPKKPGRLNYKCFPYFGGEGVAPQDIHISIS